MDPLQLHWAIRTKGKPLEWRLSGATERDALAHFVLARLSHDPDLTGALRNGGAGKVVLGLRQPGGDSVSELSEQAIASLYDDTREGERRRQQALSRLSGRAWSTW